MQRTLPLLSLLILIASRLMAQDPADSIKKVLVTPAGKPIGQPAQKLIGPAGGIIQSPDGKLRVEFPAGAVKQQTTVSIQPASNGIMSNEQGCYQLEPSGLRFQKPVTLVFTYEGNGDHSSLFGIASQDENGRWWSLRKIKTDTITKTISGEVPHFSTWALFERLILRPQLARIETQQQIDLFVEEVSVDDNTTAPNSSYSADAELLGPLSHQTIPASELSMDELPPLPINYSVASWTANGVERGDAVNGTILAGIKSARYAAPVHPPVQNPVAVTAKLQGMSYTPQGGKKMRTLYLTSHIRIIGAGYLFTYIHKNFAGCFHTIDSSTCIIKPDGNTVQLTNIINHKAWSDWNPCTHCNAEWLNKETFKANVEIWGMSNAVVTPATETNPFTKYNIKLVPAFGNTPSQKLACPKQPVVTVPSMPMPAHPTYIHFETDGKEIIIHYFGLQAKNVLSKKTNGEEFIIKIEKLGD